MISAVFSSSSAMLARGIETYSLLSWEQFRRQLRVLRARKALAETRVLCVSRFGRDYSLHDSNDSFVNLDKVTEVLGTKFRFANLHEVIDQIHEIDPTTNYTTPGRHRAWKAVYAGHSRSHQEPYDRLLCDKPGRSAEQKEL